MRVSGCSCGQARIQEARPDPNKRKNKQSIQSLTHDLRTGKAGAHDVPAIRVFEKDGKTFTWDNRRLKAFQDAGFPIRTVCATAQEIANESWKFTTKTDGSTVKVRGGGQ